MKSKVSDFKQETVAEVDLIAPFLLKIEAFEALKDLLDRAESFVRPDLTRDARASSARKQLLKLQVLRMRIPGVDDEERSSFSASLHGTLCHGVDGEWAEAAAVVLATFTDMVNEHQLVESQVLLEACKFLANKKQAIAFAKQFFNHDLGISAEHSWPKTSSARILEEMASRSPTGREKCEFLAHANTMFPFDVPIRRMLVSELHSHVLQLDSASTGPTLDLGDRFVKLILEEEGEIPGDVLQKLTLKDEYLQHFKGDHMHLVKQLREASRFADAARVAVAFAQAYNGEKEKAEAAFLLAFRLDPTNATAAGGLVHLARQVMQMTAASGEAPVASTAAAPTAASSPHEAVFLRF